VAWPADFRLQVGSLNARASRCFPEAPMLDHSTPAWEPNLQPGQIHGLRPDIVTRPEEGYLTAFLQIAHLVLPTASTWSARGQGSNPGNSRGIFSLAGAPRPAEQTRAAGFRKTAPPVEQVRRVQSGSPTPSMPSSAGPEAGSPTSRIPGRRQINCTAAFRPTSTTMRSTARSFVSQEPDAHPSDPKARRTLGAPVVLCPKL
jgi:hypothetical protein